MVSTAFPKATEAGVEMFKQGGNAIDAACAAAFALSVCEPQASGLGGQSLAILHYRGKTIGIDGSSRAPSLAHIDAFKGGGKILGHTASTLPTTTAVLGYLNFRYGWLDWSTILEPAIKLARDGYQISALQHRLLKRETAQLLAAPNKSGAKYFLKNGVVPYKPGETFKQKDLAELLEYLASHGPRAFYQGKIANQIGKDMEENGGFLRADDLALIPWPIERKPLRRRYRNTSVYTLPPPSAGNTLLLVLLMLDSIPPRVFRRLTPKVYHIFAETFRKAFLHRTEHPYGPNIYPQVTDKRMLSRDYARTVVETITEAIDPDLPLVDPFAENDTTHLSAMDAEGNAIGITQSIERVYGAKVAADGLGFLYNNYMSQFNTKDPSHPYYLRPNGVPWTQVSPAILFYRKELWQVMGSPGSQRIFSTVAQYLTHIVDRSLPIDQAMLEPRLHCSIGGKVSLEADRFNPETIDYLTRMGYKIDKREPYAFYLGAIHAVTKTQTMDGFQGVAEIRRDGTAGGI